MDRRTFLTGSLGLAGVAALAACSEPGSEAGPSSTSALAAGGATAATPEGALAAPGSTGLVDEATYQARIDEFLAFATEQEHPSDPTGIAGHLIRAHREPDYTWAVTGVTVASLQSVWDQIDAWEDTRDFRFMYLHWLLALGQGDTPMTTLDPGVIAAIEQRMIANRYRYNDPLPADRVDSQWFWSENHIIIGLVDEYLAGQRFPDATFTITGLTGAEHAARSREPILAWVDERARFGFFEWHSHVYMLKNITPLLTLIELADDPELVGAAGMALDLCLLDMAAHTHKGAFAASRGRTYKKDKATALDEDTFGTNKFLFDDTAYPYQSRTDTGATYFCAAQRYRPPQAIVEVATDPGTGVVRERHGIFVDGAAPVTEDVEAPFGYDFDDPANLAFWWSQGAVGMWQVARIGLSEAEKYRLFEAPLFAQVKLLSDLNGGDPDRIRAWEQANHAVVNFGHLREANTYSWRSDEVALTCVVDHRFGQMRDQVHAWQATIDAEALVFTTHPVTGPDESTDWGEDGKPGYWTGEASMPRSAQHERTAVHIYQPAWDATTDDLLWAAFKYRDYTHAFVPQDRFDEVTRSGNWTVARKGGGYIALWSWRAPTWREYDPAVYATDGMVQPFDLIAEGGPDNVWLVEVGDRGGAEFDAWAAAVTSADPAVERTDTGFEVEWTSPSSGAITFGSTAPFTVDGNEVALGDHPRHESPWGTVDRLATTYAIRAEASTLALDFDRRTRSVS